MRMRGWMVLGLVAPALMGCPDPDAGAELLTGRGALLVDMERVNLRVPRGDARSGSAFPTGVNAWLEMDISNLHPLEDGYLYQAWLVDGAELTSVRIPFEMRELRLDTLGIDDYTGAAVVVWSDSIPVVENGDTVSWEWLHTGPADSIVVATRGRRNIVTVRAPDLAAEELSFLEYTHLIFTIGRFGEDADPLDRFTDGRWRTPSSVFFRFRNPETGSAILSGAVRFGVAYEYLGDASLLAWSSTGSGVAEFLNVEGVGVQFNRFARPPLGYFYGVWMANSEDVDNTWVNLGPIRTPPPEYYSLFNADVERAIGVTPQVIFQGGYWVTWRELNATPLDLDRIWVTIEPKVRRDGLPPTTVLLEAQTPRDIHLLPFDEIFR